MTPQETRLHLDRIDTLVRESIRSALDGDPETADDLLAEAAPHAADSYIACSVLALTVVAAVSPMIGPGIIQTWPDRNAEWAGTEPERIAEETASFTAAFVAAVGNYDREGSLLVFEQALDADRDQDVLHGLLELACNAILATEGLPGRS